MDPSRYQRAKEIFLAACEKPAAEQDQTVRSMCSDDPEMAAEVMSLLESHRRADQISREPLQLQTQVDDSVSGGVDSADTGSGEDEMLKTARARFAPGTVIGGRYRIVSLLGVGGMGEVYRADDLTLEQPVALKFIPTAHESDPAWLERFHNEVRLSRQVTHPNVCRVFDIGQVDGEQFITMEFVDGEDLASLLRRIGRLPEDKAIEIARQVCTGLAAAHERGVLHRDLKPANVMLDGRGDVRITDFGISAPMNGAASSATGTPAYMAPEQFAKGQATVRSDIYSLGLLLYEVFTGRQVFSAHSLLEYARLHRTQSPTNPSTFIDDIDPLVERVILRCLEKDPAKRPASALAVAAALPGGDPLAAALAAGETPSPEMVAAAGGNAEMTPVRGAIVLGMTLAGLVLCVMLSGAALLIPRMNLSKPPAVLTQKAQDVLAELGYANPLGSRAQGFAINERQLAWIASADKTRSRWDRLASPSTGAAFFWYREAKDYMISRDDIGMISLDEPARNVPGMRTVILDPLGRLKRLEIQPVNSKPPDAPVATPDPAELFKLAELKMSDFALAAPAVVPPMFADTQFAWEGRDSQNPESESADNKIRLDAASLHGQWVYFRVNEAWQASADAAGIDANPDVRTGNIVLQTLLILIVTGGGVLLAWHNVRGGRGDAAGAQKVSATFLLLGILIWLLYSNHVPQLFAEMGLFFRVLGFILVPAGIVWMFYLAMEPYVRRIWPETVISWNRVLHGRFGDSLVASHILIGLAFAAAITILDELGNLIPMSMGKAAPIPNVTYMIRFLARDNPSALAIRSLLIAMYVALLYLLLLVVLQLVLRRRWLAAAAFIAVIGGNTVQWQDTGFIRWIVAGMVAGMIMLLLVRYGLVAALAGIWGMFLLRNVPLTSDMSIWYAGQTRFVVGLLIVVAIAAATAATRGWRGWERRATAKSL